MQVFRINCVDGPAVFPESPSSSYLDCAHNPVFGAWARGNTISGLSQIMPGRCRPELACLLSERHPKAFVFNLDEPLRTKKRLAAKRPPGDEPSG
jgi:hypothetical protein